MSLEYDKFNNCFEVELDASGKATVSLFSMFKLVFRELIPIIPFYDVEKFPGSILEHIFIPCHIPTLSNTFIVVRPNATAYTVVTITDIL